jgi:P-type Cu2+ transporter
MSSTVNDQFDIPLLGVESEHCALIVDKTLSKVKGVQRHRVDLNNGKAVIQTDADTVTIQEAVKSIRASGYEVATVKKQFPLTGMSCVSCAGSIESILNSKQGVIAATVNFPANSVLVEFVPTIIQAKDMKIAVQGIGYDMIIDDTEGAKEELENRRQKSFSQLRKRTLSAIVLSAPLVIIGMFFAHLPYVNFLLWALSTPVVIWLGSPFFINAWKQGRHRSANMDTLVALSTGIAYLFSVFNTLFPQFWISRGMPLHVYFEAAAVVIAFILLGKMLEERAKANTSSAIKKLIGLQPRSVNIIHADGHVTETPIAEVKTGDVVLVRPGDKIAVDGQVKEGQSYVDESMISGEPVPVLKEISNPVFAGTINQKGSFQLLAEKVGSDTLLAHIVKMVQEAQGSKAPVQKLVDRMAGIFVPVVIGIAMLSFFAWGIWGGQNGFTQGLLALVTVLVIACPCALGLATPTAIMVGVGKGAENGILIKDAESLELSYKINAIVLDKTGTLTEGKPTVSDSYWSKEPTAELLNILYSIEQSSEHPLADAVTAFLKPRARLVPLRHVHSVTGKGMQAAYDEGTYYVGNRRFLEDNNIAIADEFHQKTNAWADEGKTVVYFARNNEATALLAIADQVKPSSQSAVLALQGMGIEVYMLTGDSRQTAAAVARQVGITAYKAEVMPDDKAAYIQQLQQQGKIVAMVGDGINDSQALARADVSIAMGKGTDIAMEVAKMTLMSADLSRIPAAIRLSGKTVAAIRQNLFWAFIYNLIGIPIAAGVLYPFTGFVLNPMIAGAAMALSSVSVVSNSLRLKWVKL